MPITWSGKRRPATSEAIARIEAELGVPLPPAYLELATEFHGATAVSGNRFSYAHPRLGPVGTALYELLRLGPAGIVSRNRDLDEGLPPGVVAFGDCGGDYVCFDYRSGVGEEGPPVVYWNHEGDDDEALIPLAASFAAFVAMLSD